METTISLQKLDFSKLKNALSNEEFNALTNQILTSDKKEEPYDNIDYLNFTVLNLRRQESFADKVTLTAEIQEAISQGVDNWKFVLINEPWCSDGSFSQPVIHKIAEASNGAIDFKVILRDKHPEIMDKFLTNGGRAIPKLIILNQNDEVVGEWGPRSKELQDQVLELIKDVSATTIDKVKLTNRWYMKNKGVAIQQDLFRIIEAAKLK